MKRFYFAIIGLLFICLCGCNFNTDDSKGSLVVNNESTNENVSITAVYVKEKDSSGYQLVWSGKINSNSSEFIKLDEGEYSVKIATTNSLYDLFSSITYYETGYNTYKELIADGFITVIFDGSGIYFD